MRRLKRIAKTAAAVGPLLLGTASPAYGCLVVPASETAASHSEEIADGNVGNGPNAPFAELQRVDERAPGVTCDPMCIAGNWQDTPAGSK